MPICMRCDRDHDASFLIVSAGLSLMKWVGVF